MEHKYNETELIDFLKNSIVFKSVALKDGVFDAARYEHYIEHLFRWMDTYPKEHKFSRLNEMFYRRVYALKQSDDSLECVDAEMVLALNYETVLKLFLLSEGQLTEEETRAESLMLQKCLEKTETLYREYQIGDETTWQKFNASFETVKTIRNKGAHIYLHDDHMKIMTITENCAMIVAAYLFIVHFMEAIQAAKEARAAAVAKPEPAPAPTPKAAPQSKPAPAPKPKPAAEPKAATAADPLGIIDFKKEKQYLLCNGNLESLKKIETLANRGYIPAQILLATLYENPKKTGIPKNLDKALKWNKCLIASGKITDTDLAECLRRNGAIYEAQKDYKQAMNFYKQASDKGSLPACVRRAHLYLTGVTDPDTQTPLLKKNLQKAREAFVQAETLGYTVAKGRIELVDREIAKAQAELQAKEKAKANEYTDEDLEPQQGENGKYGYVHKKTGEVVIPYQFEKAWTFSEGLACVQQNGKQGFIDKTGKIVIPCQFEETWAFKEGFAGVQQNGKLGFIDKTGKIVIPCQFDDTWPFSEGLACVQQNGKRGFIDKTGKIVIPCQFEDTSVFKDGKAKVQQNGETFYIDKQGRRIS